MLNAVLCAGAMLTAGLALVVILGARQPRKGSRTILLPFIP